MLDGDDTSRTLHERGRWFAQEYAKKGVSGVDLKRMLALMMDSLKRGKPISDYGRENGGTWTFVNEEGEKDGNVSGVDWDDRYRLVRLYEGAADFQAARARFRVSVVVDVPKTA